MDIMSRFFKSQITSENISTKKETYSDYIQVIVGNGQFKKISGIESILNSWTNILTTFPGSYIDDPEYGSNLQKFIFAPVDNITVEGIRNEILYRLMLYDDRANINNVDIGFLNNKKGYSISIDVEYEGETDQLKLIVLENNYLNLTGK